MSLCLALRTFSRLKSSRILRVLLVNFGRDWDERELAEKGEDYLREYILPQYTVFYPVGNFLMILGLVLLLQWYLWTYLHTLMIFQ
jgi:hypothetical protein